MRITGSIPPLQGDGSQSARRDAIDNRQSAWTDSSFGTTRLSAAGLASQEAVQARKPDRRQPPEEAQAAPAGSPVFAQPFVLSSAFAGQRAVRAEPTSKVAGFGYPRTLGFFSISRLKPGPPPFGAGDPDDCARDGLRGRPHLLRLQCDAGAYERQEAWVCQRQDGAKRAREDLFSLHSPL